MRHVWTAEGCPPYPPHVVRKLEDALAAGESEVEIALGKRDTKYVVRLHPPPFRQFLKADRTKSRFVDREPAPPTRGERWKRYPAARKII